MKVERYTYPHVDGGYHLAIVLRTFNSPFPPGAKFYTDNNESLQLGSISYQAGFYIPPHNHHTINRPIMKTEEVLFVVSGRIEIDLYLHDDTIHKTVELKTGDVIILMGCGHAVRYIEDTQMIEVKQGPYLGREADKIQFTPKG